VNCCFTSGRSNAPQGNDVGFVAIVFLLSFSVIMVSVWAQLPCTGDEMRHILELATPSPVGHSGANRGFAFSCRSDGS
jgi:hypothetical protein